MKRKTPTTRGINSFFKPIVSTSSSNIPSVENVNPSEEQPIADNNSNPIVVDMQTDDQEVVASVEVAEQCRIGSTAYERDPSKRQQIWELPYDKQEEARRFYILEGAYQPYMREYPYNGTGKNHRRFQYSYFTTFPWLEYSLSTHRAYCLPCFLFTKKPSGRCGSDAFTVKGFINWKKVNDGKECAFLTHMGKDSNSAHNFSVRCFDNLKNSMTHIDKAIVQASAKMVTEARLRLKVTIDSIKGHDESPGSSNQGNFLELVKLLASYSKEVNEVVLENAPKNAKYTSHTVQQEILMLIQEVHDVHNFFQHANFIINVVSASTKRNDELLANKAAEIAHEIELGEFDTGKGQNQIGTLQKPGDTRWSSHFKSIQSLQKMFGATVEVLRSIENDRAVFKYSRGDAVGALKIIMSFDFVFILHLMEKIMKITDVLCQTLQKKSLDILNALDSVSNTKVLLGKLREDGWEPLLEEVQSFCLKHEIDIPDLNSRYIDVTKSRNKHDNTTTLHHYKADVFNVAIDQQLVELNDRFGVQSTELLRLCASLDPRHDIGGKFLSCRLF